MAETKKLRNIYEDNAHYNKAFLLYDKLGDRIGAMEKWCKSEFAQDIIPKLNVKLNDGEEFRTLGIGSGSGELEVHVLKQLLQKFPRISNHVVEPSAELSAKYKTFASENSSSLKGVDYHWNETLLQDYKEKRDKEGDETKFHFISAIHSLYYFDDLGKWLDYLYGLVAEGGILMVMITADTSGLANNMREFPKLGVKEKFDYSDIDSSHVRAHFDQSKIPYYNCLVPIRVDMTQCFDAQPSPEADLLIDFAAHCIDLRKNSDADFSSRFLKFLGSDNCTEKKDDRKLFIGDWGVTVVSK